MSSSRPWLSIFVVAASLACSSKQEHADRLPEGLDGAVPDVGGTHDTLAGDTAKSDGAPTDGSTPTTRTLTEWVGPTIWTSLIRAGAVDESERVYVSDGTNVYRVVDGKPEIYLSSADVKAALGSGLDPDTLRVDTDGKGTLYLFDRSAAGTILSSTAPHDVKQVRKFTSVGAGPTFPDWMQHVDADKLAFIAREGLYLSDSSGLKLVYDAKQVGGSPIDCAAEYLATTRDSFAFYLPGCNGSPLLGGKLDGSGFGELSTIDKVKFIHKDISNFEGIGRDRSGGIVANMQHALVSFDKTGKPTALPTSPSLDDYQKASTETDFFYLRPVVMGPSGAVYVIGQKTILKAAP
jgi:hypothetical protein